MEFSLEMKSTLKSVEETLDQVSSYSPNLAEGAVFEAMRYSLLGGGKRIRALLVVKFAEAFGGNREAAYLAASAVEMIHAYSLIHDDLPCMDNDTLRRGKPTCHIAYGEATALLAGDALLNGAFELLSSERLEELVGAKMQVALLRTLSIAAGRYGMIGGQTIDINSENKSLTEEELTYLHKRKTGALIEASAVMGAIIGGQQGENLEKIHAYAAKIGLAFQITDDILDVTGDTATLGKNIGSDSENHKTTYITLKGLEGSVKMVEKLFYEANTILDELGLKDSFIGDLTEMLRTRNK